MKHIFPLFLALALAISHSIQAQDLKLTFTSVTDAKFFVYVNGHLQNERSSGMVTVRGLEDKEYHVRIVIDDPFEVATTRSIRPDPKRSDYTVQFNAVRERVYLKAAKASRKEEEQWQPSSEADNTTSVNTGEAKPRPHPTLRRSLDNDAESQQVINRLRQQGIEE